MPAPAPPAPQAAPTALLSLATQLRQSALCVRLAVIGDPILLRPLVRSLDDERRFTDPGFIAALESHGDTTYIGYWLTWASDHLRLLEIVGGVALAARRRASQT